MTWHERAARLPAVAPFDGPGLLAWFAPRAIDGVERVDATRYARTVRVAGRPAALAIDLEAAGIRVTTRTRTAPDHDACVAIAAALMDLAAPADRIDAGLAADPALAPLVAAVPGIRLAGTADPAEMIIRAVVGQQVTVASARGLLGALAGHGEPVDPGWGLTRLLPDPETAAATAVDWYRGPAARRETVQRLARAAGAGAFATGDPGQLERALLAHKGVGPWTARYAVMRITRAPDLHPIGDVALRKGARDLGLGETFAQIDARLAACSPWRSYACLHLWRHAATLGQPRRARS